MEICTIGFHSRHERWKTIVSKSYFKGVGIDWCFLKLTTFMMIHLFSALKKRCNLVSVIAEVDRILRPQGTFIVRDDTEKIGEIEKMVESLKWDVRMTHSKYGEGVISVQKSWWRPTEVETITSAIASERKLV
ncbi:hypothetical protein HID58_078665 [Brassica napus]|uniref:Methyltransferase n=1 Tax=Brassica napus TaxID=3708 RepID=A0ABQ7YUP3_BRANA|nr:hypothetical protein HID58_078665 [Brassica napus]